MRKVAKAANRLDTLFTAALLMPAALMLMNVAIGLHQGVNTPSDVSAAAGNVVEKFTGQYVPYVETTSTAITGGVGKLASAATNCFGGTNNPVYISPAMAGKSGCGLARAFGGGSGIKPYGTY